MLACGVAARLVPALTPFQCEMMRRIKRENSSSIELSSIEHCREAVQTALRKGWTREDTPVKSRSCGRIVATFQHLRVEMAVDICEQPRSVVSSALEAQCGVREDVWR
jgi:hypothetical protein